MPGSLGKAGQEPVAIRITSAVTCLPPTEMVLRSISSARDSISAAPAFARVDL
jgi:hypothetical protein